MKNSVAFATIVISFSRYAASYLTPASPKAIDPQPNEYLNWLPDHPGHGQFHSKNSSVTPWKPRPRPHHPPHYSLPSQCSLQDYSQDSSFWLPNFDGAYQGTSPFLVNGTNYTVFRNVKDFGAAGDGITDDTAAFNNAITCK